MVAIAIATMLAILAAVLSPVFSKSKRNSFRVSTVAAIGITVFIVYWFVPWGADLLTELGLKRDELPVSTRDAILMSDQLKFNWGVVLAGLALLLIAYRVFVRTRVGSALADRVKLTMLVAVALVVTCIVVSMLLPLNELPRGPSAGNQEELAPEANATFL